MAQEHQEYIQAQVNPVLESLVTQLLLDRPENPVPTMIKWLCEQSNKPMPKLASDTPADSDEIAKLKKELSDLQTAMKEMEVRTGVATDEGNQDEEEPEEDDDDDDVVEEVAPPANYSRGPRSSVSAEAYGAWNQKTAFVPKVISKTDEQKTRIKSVISKSFLFSALDPKDMGVVVDAMVEVDCTAGQRIINEGEDGKVLYVCDQGTFDCYKKIGGEEKLVKTYEEGDAFGELALLYNCPRAASVQSRDTSKLWELDRETFNHIVKDAAQKKREMYEEFLTKVKILESMDSYERNSLADALHQESYDTGSTIVKQGEQGDKFFILEEGECVATKDGQEVMQYKKGDYFGELALLKNAPRAANVVAKTPVKVVSIDRRTFKGLLGPLGDLLKRQTETYK